MTSSNTAQEKATPKANALSKECAICLIGYACHLAVVSFLGWNGVLVFVGDEIERAQIMHAASAGQVVSYPIVFLLIGVIANLADNRKMILPLFVSAVCFVTSCIVFAVAMALFHDEAMQFALPFGIVVGIGTALFFVLWQWVFAMQTIKQAALEIIGGTLLAGILFFAASNVPSAIVSTIILGTCFAGNVAAFAIARTIPRDAPDAINLPAPKPNVSEALKALWRPALCVAALGFACGITPSLFLNGDTLGTYVGFRSIGRAVSALILFFAWKLLAKEDNDLGKFYQIVFPIVATGFLLLPFLGETYQLGFSTFVYTMFSIASMLMMLTCALESSKRNLPALAVYGVFAGFVYSFSRFGMAIGSMQNFPSKVEFSQILIVALLIIYLLSLAMFASKSFRKPKDEESPSPAPNAATENGAFEAACDSAAEQFSLTKREGEVLRYIARGRDVPFISATLYISENTVRAHSKKIYRKMDVRNKQDLISLIEGLESSAAQVSADETEQ